MQPDAYFHFDLRHVFDLEGCDGVQDVQRHVGHLGRVPVRVPVGDTGSHHVGVSDGLHLQTDHHLAD